MHTDGGVRRWETSTQDKNRLPGSDVVFQQDQNTYGSRDTWGSKEKCWWKPEITMYKNSPSERLWTTLWHQCVECHVVNDKRPYLVLAVLSATLSCSRVREALSGRSKISCIRTRANVAEAPWKERFWCESLGQVSSSFYSEKQRRKKKKNCFQLLVSKLELSCSS